MKFTVAAIVLLSCSSMVIAQQTFEIKEKPELAMIATADCTSYRLDEEIMIEVKLVNTGKTAVFLFFDLSSGLSLRVQDNTGRGIAPSVWVDNIVIPSVDGDMKNLVRLAPRHF